MAISKKSSHFFGPLLENGSDFVKCQNSSPVSGTSISHLIWVLDYLASCCWAYADPEGIKNDLCRLHMRVYIIYRGGGGFFKVGNGCASLRIVQIVLTKAE